MLGCQRERDCVERLLLEELLEQFSEVRGLFRVLLPLLG